MGEKKMDAAREEMDAFTQMPDLSPAAQLEADSYVDSMAEQLADLKKDGFHVPEKKEGAKLDLPDSFSGIEQGFNTEAELSPAAQLEADSYVDSMAEQLADLKKGGFPVPEKKEGAKLDLPDSFGGIEQGFFTQPDVTPLEEAEDKSYVVSGEEALKETKEALKD